MTADTAIDLAQSLAGGHQPPGKPPVAAGAAAEPPRPSESSTIRMRSFGPMPARLSPVKRGEIRVGRPEGLVGTGEAAFAFYPPDNQLAPMLRDRDLMYAVEGEPNVNDLIVVIDRTGSARIGILAKPVIGKLTLIHGENSFAYDLNEIKEVGIIQIIHRDGRADVVVVADAA